MGRSKVGRKMHNRGAVYPGGQPAVQQFNQVFSRMAGGEDRRAKG